MEHGTSLMLSMLLGAIGTGFLVYGKKQRKGVALLSGLILCIYPYFVDSLTLLLFIAALLIAAPFILKQ